MSLSSHPVFERNTSYAHDHDRQTLDIFTPHVLNLSHYRTSKIWLIFIHGGAWCDPCHTSAELHPAVNLLYADRSQHHDVHAQQRSERITERIVGYASINYGLSPRPGDPSDEKSRNVRHPRHLQDVVTALRWLGEKHKVGVPGGWKYIIMGHSCGATMLFQLAMGVLNGDDGGDSGFGMGVERPVALVGLEGLYDLALLVRNHADEKFYRDFVESAFPGGERVWRGVSPVSGEKERLWEGVRSVVLGMSAEDELVEWEQVEVMRKVIDPGGNMEREGRFRLLGLDGRHDEVWEKGIGVVRALEVALGMVFGKE